MHDSSISKFFEKSREERLNTIANFANLSKYELEILENTDGKGFPDGLDDRLLRILK